MSAAAKASWARTKAAVLSAAEAKARAQEAADAAESAAQEEGKVAAGATAQAAVADADAEVAAAEASEAEADAAHHEAVLAEARAAISDGKANGACEYIVQEEPAKVRASAQLLCEDIIHRTPSLDAIAAYPGCASVPITCLISSSATLSTLTKVTHFADRFRALLDEVEKW